MNDFKLCGIVVCGVVLCSVFKGIKNEYSIFIRIGITALVTILSLALFIPILSYIDEITENTVNTVMAIEGVFKVKCY